LVKVDLECQRRRRKKILALILWKGNRCIIAVSPLCDRLPEAFWRGRGDHGSGECRVWVRAM
jgi:hypothetical protein